MSDIPFHYLDALEKYKIPNKQEKVRIRFGESSQPPVQETDIESEEMKGEEKEEAVFNPIKIFDRRKTSTLDYASVMNRLREKDVFIVKTSEAMPLSSGPATPLSSGPASPLSSGPASLGIQASELPKVEPKNKPLVIRDSISIAKEKMETEAEGKEEKDKEDKDEGITELNEILAKKPDVVVGELVDQEEVMAAIKDALPKKGRKLQINPTDNTTVIESTDLTRIAIRDQAVADRLPKEREKVIVKAPTYYMNNRKLFIKKIIDLFAPYRQEITSNQESVTCESRASENFDLLTHQKIVRDYLNLYTPYRGILLMHGLGSGKTCSSIALAEGMKSNKRVFVMTPASLKMNFFSEMKKCGDELYKKNQFWEFISIEGKPEYVNALSKALSLSVDYIRKQKGAWLLNIANKTSNYNTLTTAQQEQLDDQLDQMIRSKYTDINYNGLNMKKIQTLTGDFSRNPFDNSVIIIDEAHNFVSRIVNKIKKPKSISYILYDLIMNASNARVILLTGTPIINYPNEIGILYNLLRGYIKTWSMTVNVKTSEKINTDSILSILDKEKFNTFDYVEYSGNNLMVTRNPFGFVNTKKRGVLKGTQRLKVVNKGGAKKTRKASDKKPAPKLHVETSGFAAKYTYEKEVIHPSDEIAETNYNVGMNGSANPYAGGSANPYAGGSANPQVSNHSVGGGDVFNRYDGVKLDDSGNISDADFLTNLLRILRKNGMEVPEASIEIRKYKALPDDSEAFLNSFVNTEAGIVKNINLFQKRILGLTSYFRSAQEQLLPSFVKTQEGDIYHVVKTPLSEHQLGIYEKIRKVEADQESSAKKRRLKAKDGDELFNISSTYRIFSRAACNFVFPPDMERPTPNIKPEKDLTENAFDAVPKALLQDNDVYLDTEDQEVEIADSDASKYANRIEKALEDVNVKDEGTNKSTYLDKDVLSNLSPKFAKILENLTDPENKGLHLLYSHFRTIEGIGILRLILLANGFAEFKLQKIGDAWVIKSGGDEEENQGKPRFVLYTGTETAEEKEIIRNIYNGTWDLVPASISKTLRDMADNNVMGDIIKVFMITSSGAEGINLRNTRFVHVVEPYWHMVRPEQVVGRARRICSHQDLPEEMRTVKVFLYVATLSEEQKIDEKHIELRIRDLSRLDKKTPVTTDETLYEIASIKQRINNQILKAVKETAIDCNLYSALSEKSGEPLVCYGFGKVESNQYSSYPSFERDRDEKEGLDLRVLTWKAREITYEGKEYALNEDTYEVYDLESYNRAVANGSEPIMVGRLENIKGNYRLVK
jgi:hypothetical protein